MFFSMSFKRSPFFSHLVSVGLLPAYPDRGDDGYDKANSSDKGKNDISDAHGFPSFCVM
jgi:hypothetical protein